MIGGGSHWAESIRGRQGTLRLPCILSSLIAIAAAVATARAEGAGNSHGAHRIRELLRSRVDRASSERVVRELALLCRGPEAERAATALLQARFFLAENYLQGDEQVRTNEENVREGLSHLSRALRTPLRSFDDLDEVRERVPREAASLLFWTTASFGRTIESLSVFSQMGAAARFRRSLERLIALDGGYFFGAPHGALALYFARAPAVIGGDPALARRHALLTLQIAPRFAGNHVQHAEVIMRSGGREPEYVQALNRALDLPDDDAAAEAKPEQRAAKARARALLEGAPLE